MEQIFVEKTASRGIAAAKVYKYQDPDLRPSLAGITAEQAGSETERFLKARQQMIVRLQNMEDDSGILAAHIEVAKDRMLEEGVILRIREEQKNAELAVWETIDEIAGIFAGMDDPYMKEREADVRDIGKRMMAELKGVALPDLGEVSTEVIVAAADLYPSDTVKLNPKLIKGIITEKGGLTSHVSILAKSMNIPALIGVTDILSKLENGMMVCMDAEKGMIVIDPDDEVLSAFRVKQEAYLRERHRLEQLRSQPAVTRDGKRISLCANVGSVEDIENALEMNVDGVGLFRTEYLYMGSSHFPTEEEQFQVYARAARLCPKELTIRTLDIGGDKKLDYFPFDQEENPFLGWRAIRISLDMKEMFKEQLRAILRASAFGHVRIMFPLIISLEELREAREMVAVCQRELEQEGEAFDREIPVGMMMETPASVLMAEEFAAEADFFSIGTNDLTQYLLAVDRGNKRIANRFDYFHPAVLRAIRHIIAAGHKAGIQVGMCGEMAGDPRAVLLLLEMGLDEFSMSAGSVDYVREQILSYGGQKEGGETEEKKIEGNGDGKDCAS